MNDLITKAIADNMVQTPAGIMVTPGAVDSLVKAQAAEEARKIAKDEDQKRGALFSRLIANMGMYGAREKPQNTPNFQTLRLASKASFVDAILIRARVDQTKRIWTRTFSDEKIGFRVVHERHDDPDYKGSKADDARCREVEELLMDPTPAGDNYLQFYPHHIRPHGRIKDLVAVLTKAELVIDRKVIRRIKRADGKGYAAFHWLPGETIKNVDEALKEWAKKNETDGKVNRYTAERASYATSLDLTRSSYVQVIDGMPVDAFYPEEISVHISNPSDELNRWGYGESRLELSMDITATLMYAWNFNKEMFKTNYPESILTVQGDFDKEGLQAFKQMLLADTGLAGNYWRLPVIPSQNMDNFKLEAHKLRETPKDMLFDQFVRLLIMMKAAAYGAHPTILNLQTDSGNGAGSIFGHNPSEEIEFSKEHGLIPAVTDMCEWLTDSIVKPRYPDLKLIVVGLEKEDEKQTVDLRATRSSKWVTRNEARMEEGKPPLGFWVEPEEYKKLSDGDKAKYDQNPWNYPSDVAIPNYINTFQMASQGQDDDQPDDQEQNPGGQPDDGQGQQWQDNYQDPYAVPQPIEKSRRERKFIEITIED